MTLIQRVILILVFLLHPLAASSQITSNWEINNKLDDILFELEMQRMERNSYPFAYDNPYKWPKNLKHLFNNERGSHYIDVGSITMDGAYRTANVFVVFPNVKKNKYGTYKAIGIMLGISCNYSTAFEHGGMMYDKEFHLLDFGVNTSGGIYSKESAPSKLKESMLNYVKYICK